MPGENEPYVSPTSETVEPTTDEAAASETTEEVEGAEPSETVEETEEETEQTEQPPKKENAVQKRIDQITKEKHEARAEAEYWKKVATGEIKPQEPVQEQPTVHPDGKPQVEQFDSYEDFVEALTDWKADQREKQKEQATRAKTIAEQNATRIEQARTTHEDFDEAVSNLNGIMVPPVTIEAIQESELSAEVFYYLGKNVAEAKKLQGMSIPAQLREIGRIEEKLSTKPVEKETKRVSSAPVPLNPVGASATASPKNLDEITDDEEWLKRERTRLAKQGRLY